MNSATFILLWITLVRVYAQSRETIFYYPMNTTASDWIGTYSVLAYPNSNCPNAKGYCWDVSGATISWSHITATTGFHTIYLMYSIKTSGISGPKECSIEYSPDAGTTPYDVFRTSGSDISSMNDQIFQLDATADDNVDLMLLLSSSASNVHCYFNELVLTGIPITQNPTVLPTTNPTQSTVPPTKYPTISPTKTPTQSTNFPSIPPTLFPTISPTLPPTAYTQPPTVVPTSATNFPTLSPTDFPTLPSASPTSSPTYYQYVSGWTPTPSSFAGCGSSTPQTLPPSTSDFVKRLCVRYATGFDGGLLHVNITWNDGKSSGEIQGKKTYGTEQCWTAPSCITHMTAYTKLVYSTDWRGSRVWGARLYDRNGSLSAAWNSGIVTNFNSIEPSIDCLAGLDLRWYGQYICKMRALYRSIDTFAPTMQTVGPTRMPTKAPSDIPSATPTEGTLYPTLDPTFAPTMQTIVPTRMPTKAPTDIPSSTPTEDTGEPTVDPTLAPTATTAVPSSIPTSATLDPTVYPTFVPTDNSAIPSSVPTGATVDPTGYPTVAPTATSGAPTFTASAPSAIEDNGVAVLRYVMAILALIGFYLVQ